MRSCIQENNTDNEENKKDGIEYSEDDYVEKIMVSCYLWHTGMNIVKGNVILQHKGINYSRKRGKSSSTLQSKFLTYKL